MVTKIMCFWSKKKHVPLYRIRYHSISLCVHQIPVTPSKATNATAQISRKLWDDSRAIKGPLQANGQEVYRHQVNRQV